MLFQYSGNFSVIIDGFPVECKRTVPGALYIHPHTTFELTEDEHQHIVERHGAVAAFIRSLETPVASVITPSIPEPLVDPLVKHVLQPSPPRPRRMSEEDNSRRRGGEKE